MQIVLGKLISGLTKPTVADANILVTARFYAKPAKATVTAIDEEFHLMGDVDWDGKIDDRDMELLQEAYGKTAEECPECDLNGDGIIDILDLATAGKNYGKTAPTKETPFTEVKPVGRLRLISSYADTVLDTGIFDLTKNTKITFIYHFLLSYIIIR